MEICLTEEALNYFFKSQMLLKDIRLRNFSSGDRVYKVTQPLHKEQDAKQTHFLSGI